MATDIKTKITAGTDSKYGTAKKAQLSYIRMSFPVSQSTSGPGLEVRTTDSIRVYEDTNGNTSSITPATFFEKVKNGASVIGIFGGTAYSHPAAIRFMSATEILVSVDVGNDYSSSGYVYEDCQIRYTVKSTDTSWDTSKIQLTSGVTGRGMHFDSSMSSYENGRLNISLPAATASTLGGVKVGDGLSVTSDGTLNAEGWATVELTASASTISQAKYDVIVDNWPHVLLNVGGGIYTPSATYSNSQYIFSSDDYYKFSSNYVMAATHLIRITSDLKLDKTNSNLGTAKPTENSGYGIMRTDETSLKTSTDGNGVISVKDGGITSAKLADGAVTAGKIADGAITEDKLASGVGGGGNPFKISNKSSDIHTLNIGNWVFKWECENGTNVNNTRLQFVYIFGVDYGNTLEIKYIRFSFGKENGQTEDKIKLLVKNTNIKTINVVNQYMALKTRTAADTLDYVFMRTKFDSYEDSHSWENIFNGVDTTNIGSSSSISINWQTPGLIIWG